ncbi:glycosyltransferase [Chitinimonas sp. BJB300]|nr:glycosyltransferase [Chitinimonas sp. BJB300]TSJ85305.1 glycosyltransferase family 4 protein [Chitinimonas sp. BJB300]
MIAYHFPPLQGSSGILRTLHFARALPNFGWTPSVLSADIRAYEATSNDLLDKVPAGLQVQRAFALDASRHLAFFRRYPGWLARPDRWTSWLVGAIPAGLRMIRARKPDLLWSTYPIPSAHLIGYWLARITGIPWVADFRDPMAHAGYPENAKTWQSYLKTEQRVFARASLAVFATEGAARLYKERYPFAAARIKVVENGYDETAFPSTQPNHSSPTLNPGKITLLHSGIVYPAWRNPAALLSAVAMLIKQGQLNPNQFRLRFRAPVHDAFLAKLVDEHQLGTVVEVLPALDYAAAIGEMLAADGLFLLQSAECNDQIPAKFYEYLRAGKPIIAFTDPAGDTASVMHQAGLPHIADLDDADAIARTFLPFVQAIQSNTAPIADANCIRLAARDERTRQLAGLLDALQPQHPS